MTAETPTPDYYAVLGLDPTATTDQIKAAYRAAAKRAHPDAGGSAQAMAQVNEAHQVLADPTARAAYDELRTAKTQPRDPDPAAQDFQDAVNADAAARLHHRMRQMQARSSAWRLIRATAPFALLLAVLGRVLGPLAPTLSQKLLVAALSFLPAYALIVGFIFLFMPDLRLALHDLFDRTPNDWIPRRDLWWLLGLALAYFPLAGLWLVLISLRA